MESVTSATAYTSVRRNSVEKRRHNTDRCFLVVFTILFGVWISANFYAFTEGTIFNESLTNSTWNNDHNNYLWLPSFLNETDLIIYSVNSYYGLSITKIIGYTAFGYLLLTPYLVIQGFRPRFFIYLAVLTLHAWSLYAAFKFVRHLVHVFFDFSYRDLDGMFWNFVKFVLNNALIIGICRFGADAVEGIIHKAFRAISFFRSIVWFILFIAIVLASMLLLAIPALHLIDNDVLRYIIIFGLLYTYSCVVSFANVVISQAVAIKHWPSSDENFDFLVWKCVGVVFKYHLGSIALSATGIIPLYQVILVAIKFQHKTAKKYENLFLEITCKTLLILTISNYAEVFIAIHGYDCYESVKCAFQLMVKNSWPTLAVTGVFHGITIFGFYSTYLTILYIYEPDQLSRSDIDSGLNASFTGTSAGGLVLQLSIVNLFIIPILMTAWSAVRATLVCSLEDENDDNDLQKDCPPNYDSCVSR